MENTVRVEEHEPVNELDVQLWALKMAEKSIESNFNPEYSFRAGAAPVFVEAIAKQETVPGVEIFENRVKISFKKIADDKTLKVFSDLCESDYLRKISELRNEFVHDAKNFKAGADAANLQFERWMCKEDLYYLVKFVLGYNRLEFHLHKHVAEGAEKLGPGARSLVELPRDTFKSTIRTIGFSIQRILRNPDVRILFKSNTQGNASKKLTETKNHFIQNEILKKLFPEHVPQRVSDQGSGSSWTTPARKAMNAEGTLEAAGVGTSSTSCHYDIIVGDDFWDEDSVTSQEVMTKTRNEIGSLEYLLASPSEGIIQFVGTRFAHDDPTGDLRKAGYHCMIASGITKLGRSLFPKELVLAKLYYQAHTKLYIFSCQIMLNPTQEDQGFDRAWFKYMRWSEMHKLELEHKISVRKVILTDAARDNKKNSDPISIQVLAIDNHKRKLVCEYIRKKMAPLEFLQMCFSLTDKWLPEFVCVQNAPLEAALKSFIADENRKRTALGRRPVKFYEHSLGRNSKIARMEALQPYFMQGEIYFDPDIKTIPELENEILSFPHNMSNDDGMDSLSEICDPVVSRAPVFNGETKIDEGDYDGMSVEQIQEKLLQSTPENDFRRANCAAVFKKIKNNENVREVPGMVVGF